MTTGTSGSAVTGPAVRGAEYALDEGVPGDEISLLDIANLLLRRWRIVAGVPILAASLALILAFVVPPTYTATTTFVPEIRSQMRLPGALAGIAGQLGIPLGGDPSQSPRFYAGVIRSRELLERVLLASYANPRAASGAADSTTLLRILRVRGRSAPDSLHRGVKKLNKLLAVSVDNQTNIVAVRIDARWPGLAAAVANRLVTFLNDFNNKTRQSQARERRKFTEQRVADAGAELQQAEASVKTFYERNRGWQESPALAFEEARLRRQVDIGREVYLSLRREYETARIEEVNDTPVMTVIDPAVPPQERSQPKRLLWTFLGLVFGAVVAVSWAFGAAYFERARREEEPEYREFGALLERLRRDILGFVRPRRAARE